MTAYNDFADAKRYAQHSDESPNNAGYERPAIRRILGEVSGLRVLDAGCAAGGHIGWLNEHGAQVVGLDLSHELLELARARYPETPLVQADFSDLPFGDGAFDLILSSLALHYVEDWEQPLAEFRRVLRPSGRLVASVHHPIWDWPQLDGSDYFKTGWIDRHWTLVDDAPLQVRYHRKTIAQVLNALSKDFRIKAVFEPYPEEWLHDKYPAKYDRMMRTPTFLFIDAIAEID